MVAVRPYLLKGLMEGLVLSAIERQPTHGYGILKEIEDKMGEAPNKNQVYPLLQRLEEDGLLTSEEDPNRQGSKIYSLTRDGDSRLREYRTLPDEFKQWLVHLFSITAGAAQAPPPAGAEAGEAPPETPRGALAPVRAPQWVTQVLDQLPEGPVVRAPFAQVRLDRRPNAGQWELKVDHHEPKGYEGWDECPLTFLYLASQKLLFSAPPPGRER